MAGNHRKIGAGCQDIERAMCSRSGAVRPKRSMMNSSASRSPALPDMIPSAIEASRVQVVRVPEGKRQALQVAPEHFYGRVFFLENEPVQG